jgi:potassium efflux system protein
MLGDVRLHEQHTARRIDPDRDECRGELDRALPQECGIVVVGGSDRMQVDDRIDAVGLLLQSVGNPGRYSDSLGQACMMLVLPLFALQLLRWTLLDLGLAHAHFRWRRPRREALRRAVPRAAAVILPMHFIVSLAFIRNLDLPNDVQARLAAVIAAAALAWTLWWLLDTGRLFLVRGAASEAGALRKLLRLALPAASLKVSLATLMLPSAVLSASGVKVAV